MEQKLIELMQSPDFVPLTIDDIAAKFNLSGGQRAELETVIKDSLANGVIVKVKKERYCLPRDADLVTGVIRFKQSGTALIYPENTPGQPLQDPIFVKAEDTWVAMHDDKVVARIMYPPKRGRYSKQRGKGRSFDEDRKTARVIRILKRARETLTGTLASTKFFYYVIPDDPRIINDILVADPKEQTWEKFPEVNDKVVVKLHEWKQRHVNPEGEIIEVLGKTHTPQAEYASILHKYELDTVFPECVEFEVSKIPDKIDPEAIKGRRDYRQTFTITIDPDDAKDFDDALSYEELSNGDVKVAVHIADVSHYVKPNSALDKEAKNRGNSTYLVGTVIPMLPEKLSNGLCSLVEDQDRLVKTVEFHFTKQGKFKPPRFYNSVIRSRKRLTYGQALAFLRDKSNQDIWDMPLPPSHQTGNTGKALTELNDAQMDEIRKVLKKLWTLAKRQRERRMKKGSLELDMPEIKIYVDEQGYADRIVKNETDESHQLIEEWMLLANDTVGQSLTEDKLATIYRVHDEPDEDKLIELADHMATFGIETGDLTIKKEINRLLARIAQHPQGYMLKIQVLRSLKAACYRSTPDGHYGLSMKHYTHFTSPIRRYADLIVHRVFDVYLRKRGFSTAPLDSEIHYSASQVASIAEHLSITEGRSAEAERETVKTKLMEFFERELDSSSRTAFTAIVTEVKNHGMFVELTDSMAYGLIHISTMLDDHYYLTNDDTELVGRRNRRRFRVGDKIQVMVERVDRFKRQIDFSLADLSPVDVKPKVNRKRRRRA